MAGGDTDLAYLRLRGRQKPRELLLDTLRAMGGEYAVRMGLALDEHEKSRIARRERRAREGWRSSVTRALRWLATCGRGCTCVRERVRSTQRLRRDWVKEEERLLRERRQRRRQQQQQQRLHAARPGVGVEEERSGRSTTVCSTVGQPLVEREDAYQSNER